MSKRRLGVFICHCGGNISDYVDVERVREAVSKEDDVVVAKTHMFACSDASQHEMAEDIQKEKLDGIVVASCSPKLHLYTFRAMAERAGLNPYQYTQVNLREQCSWAHRKEKEEATEKGIELVRAGIGKTRLSEPLEKLRVETKPKVLVIGAGIAGLRSAISLAELGLTVYVIEKEQEAGGWVAKWGKMFPSNRTGSRLIADLKERLDSFDNAIVYTGANLVSKEGSVGDFKLKVRLDSGDEVTLEAGAVVVATGFDPYEPQSGEYGYGTPGVVTLPEFEEILKNSTGSIEYNGRRVRDIVYVYCVGSRENAVQGKESRNLYCSRYCCTAANHTAIKADEIDKEVNQIHLYRDMRTYGKNELLYEEAAHKGSVFVRFSEDSPPEVSREGDKLLVRVKDVLLGGEELEIPADLVVLVTGMVPRKNDQLVDVLKLPIGRDGFFNEIHPKLRPVETVNDGIFIAGTSQGPKTASESVASSMAAVSKAAALLLKGYVDLEPFVAKVDPDKCTWCGLCEEACPYGAIKKTTSPEGKDIAEVVPALCKGEGACVPVCPQEALDLAGYGDAQIKEMIKGLLKMAG